MTISLATKAGWLWQAWLNTQKVAPPNYNAIRMVLMQALHEDGAGAVWDGYGGWGCCDLRALNAAEIAAFAAGSLKVGMWLYPDSSWGAEHRPDSIGTIRGDSDPNTGPFHVWFAAFPQGPGGPGYMLRAGIRGTVAVLADPFCAVETYATSLYLNQCYYGGVHPTAAEVAKGMPHPRWCGKRTLPLNAAEEANIADYVHAMKNHDLDIDSGLKSWRPPGEYSEPAPDVFVEHVSTDAPDDETGATGRSRRGEAPLD